MKYFSKAAVFVVAATMMVGCEKDNPTEVPEGAMMLSAEGFSGNGSKTSVSDEMVQWVAGDVVNINGTDYTVGISGDGKAYTTSTVTSASTYYGYYPGSIVKNDGQSTTPTVTLPSRYHSSYSGGRQVLALPMAAYNNGTTETLKFKHLTAAVKVTVKNSTGFDGLYIDSVQVVSATQNLCGDVTLTLTDENYNLSAATGSNNAVTVYFDRESVQIDNNATLEVQVPILPIASATNDLTVKVYSHNKAPIVLSKPGIAPANYDFNYSQTRNAPALARNVMSAANVAVTNNTNHTTTVDHSLFTINASGDKVRFSQGNLQATYGVSAWSWAFATNQWEYIGNATANTSINGNGTVSANGTVDLFGWVGASSTVLTSAPAMYGISNSTNYSDYGNSTSDALKSDWGTLAITNGGNTANSGWRTLTGGGSGEWYYLFDTRASGSTVNGQSDARWTHAIINTDGTSVNGVILFPDNVTIAAGEATSWGTINGNSEWGGTKCTTAQWAALEAKGCVFLPAAGYRYGSTVRYAGTYGFYWSSTPDASNAYGAYDVYFNSGDLGPARPNGRRDYGRSVRLVCE